MVVPATIVVLGREGVVIVRSTNGRLFIQHRLDTGDYEWSKISDRNLERLWFPGGNTILRYVLRFIHFMDPGFYLIGSRKHQYVNLSSGVCAHLDDFAQLFSFTGMMVRLVSQE